MCRNIVHRYRLQNFINFVFPNINQHIGVAHSFVSAIQAFSILIFPAEILLINVMCGGMCYFVIIKFKPDIRGLRQTIFHSFRVLYMRNNDLHANLPYELEHRAGNIFA